jgi:hypothetical protein
MQLKSEEYMDGDHGFKYRYIGFHPEAYGF